MGLHDKLVQRITIRESLFIRRLYDPKTHECCYEGVSTRLSGPWQQRYINDQVLALFQTKP